MKNRSHSEKSVRHQPPGATFFRFQQPEPVSSRPQLPEPMFYRHRLPARTFLPDRQPEPVPSRRRPQARIGVSHLRGNGLLEFPSSRRRRGNSLFACMLVSRLLRHSRLASMLALFCLTFSCGRPDPKRGFHFTSLSPSETGVSFENTITESDSLNMFVNEYTYMGAGVGIGDFNKDGLPDIFFAGNQVSSKLYLNKGSLNFEDITGKAGVATSAWCTGVSVVDINNDGWPDIYVCVSGRVGAEHRKNLLFINQHDLTFREQAEAYGLADTAMSTQAVFFDYDRDGRLDMYLLNHTLDDVRPNDIRDRRVDTNAMARDKLYHNEGPSSGMDHPFFRDVSKSAGIEEDGNGLGVVVSDINGDGYPDIYVANDYIVNDLLWLNKGDGTFTNAIATAMRHQSYSSMGADAADLNNDGRVDVMSLDMQPETSVRKKMMYSFLGEERRRLELAKGYEPEYIHNMVQLNNGNRDIGGHPTPFFSEMGNMAGMAETDWSWSVLIADLDNDGWKDVHITNGLGRDPTNIDFLEYRHERVMQTNIADSDAAQRRVFMQRLTELGPVRLRGYLFKNKTGLRWQDVSTEAGLTEDKISNGAIYADLDNDGDLDLVTNNINGPASILRNDCRNGSPTTPPQAPTSPKSTTSPSVTNSPSATPPSSATTSHSVNTGPDATSHGIDSMADASGFLTILLHGDSLNLDGIGARVFAYTPVGTQFIEQYPVRGYLSSVDNRLHFGFGTSAPDSMRIVWPDGKTQLLVKPGINKFLELNYADAVPETGSFGSGLPNSIPGGGPSIAIPVNVRSGTLPSPAVGHLPPASFTDATVSLGIDFRHRETFFYDFAFQPLIQQKYSQEGPFLAIGDLDGDGRQDFVVGGAFRQSGQAFLQLSDGRFRGKDMTSPTKNEEDLGICLFDADGDGDLDCLIAGGSTEFESNSWFCRPRLYLNDGRGNFKMDSMAFLSPVITPGKAVAVADMDGDGDQDIFLGGRVSLGSYPNPPRSFILRNEHGKFYDVTDEICPALKNAGLINAAVWKDIDGDNRPDLIIAGDWMPIRVFHNNGKTLTEITTQSGLSNLSGFWRSITVEDLNHDGYPDIAAGNLGLNNPFHIIPDRPAELIAKDFDGNGIVEPIFCYYIKGDDGQYRLCSGISRDLWATQMPSIKKIYDHNEPYAHASMDQVFTPQMMAGATVLPCNEVRSGWFENNKHGGFIFHPFTDWAQIAPVNAIACTDLNGDGNPDLIVAGNEYQAAVTTGRYDASYGLVLLGDGKGGFQPVDPSASGLILDGDVKDLKIMNGKDGKILLVAVNDGPVSAYRLNQTDRRKAAQVQPQNSRIASSGRH